MVLSVGQDGHCSRSTVQTWDSIVFPWQWADRRVREHAICFTKTVLSESSRWWRPNTCLCDGHQRPCLLPRGALGWHSALRTGFHSNSAQGMTLPGNSGSRIRNRSTGFKGSSAAVSFRRKSLAIYFVHRYLNNVQRQFGRNFNLCKMKKGSKNNADNDAHINPHSKRPMVVSCLLQDQTLLVIPRKGLKNELGRFELNSANS